MPNRKQSLGLRRRNQLWPDADKSVFHPKEERGYCPLPYVIRELMRCISPPQFRVYVYICLRADKHFICWPTLEEIADALGLSSRRKLTPHLKWLEDHGFIATKSQGGKKFFLIHHPRIPILGLYDKKLLTDEHLDQINELLEKVGQDRVEPKPKVVTMKAGASIQP